MKKRRPPRNHRKPQIQLNRVQTVEQIESHPKIASKQSCPTVACSHVGLVAAHQRYVLQVGLKAKVLAGDHHEHDAHQLHQIPHRRGDQLAAVQAAGEEVQGEQRAREVGALLGALHHVPERHGAAQRVDDVRADDDDAAAVAGEQRRVRVEDVVERRRLLHGGQQHGGDEQQRRVVARLHGDDLRHDESRIPHGAAELAGDVLQRLVFGDLFVLEERQEAAAGGVLEARQEVGVHGSSRLYAVGDWCLVRLVFGEVGVCV